MFQSLLPICFLLEQSIFKTQSVQTKRKDKWTKYQRPPALSIEQLRSCRAFTGTWCRRRSNLRDRQVSGCYDTRLQGGIIRIMVQLYKNRVDHKRDLVG